MAAISVPSERIPSLEKVPGPPPSRFLGKYGNIIQFGKDTTGFADKLYKEYGPVASMVKGGRGANIYSPEDDCQGSVFVCGPELAYNYATQHDTYAKPPLSGLLYKKRNDSPRTAPLKHFLAGLFGLERDEHRRERRMLQPAFSKKHITMYREDMVGITQGVLDHLQVGKQYDFAAETRELTARIATKTLFGQDYTVGNGIEAQAAITLQEIIASLANPLTSLLALDIPGSPYHNFLTRINRFDRQMRSVVEHKRAQGGEASDILSVLLQTSEEGQTLSEDQLLAHVGVIFAAGHETSNNAIDWALMLLSQYPQVQADVLDELQSVLHGDAPTLEQLPQLPLLERVIKESMRLIPPAPLNFKMLAEPAQVGQYLLPAHTVMYLNIYTLHHLPEIYPDPFAFKPQRWETINPSIDQYQPFGGGPRMCLGAAFAMMEIKIVLAMLLQRFRVQLLPNQKIDRFGTITIAPKGGLQVTLHPQDRRFQQGVGGITGNVREMVSLPA